MPSHLWPFHKTPGILYSLSRPPYFRALPGLWRKNKCFWAVVKFLEVSVIVTQGNQVWLQGSEFFLFTCALVWPASSQGMWSAWGTQAGPTTISRQTKLGDIGSCSSCKHQDLPLCKGTSASLQIPLIKWDSSCSYPRRKQASFWVWIHKVLPLVTFSSFKK